jgi:hypothetical protein
MIARLIVWPARNLMLVLLATLFAAKNENPRTTFDLGTVSIAVVSG